MIIQARRRGLTLSVKPGKRKERCGEDGEGRRKRREASIELDSARTKETIEGKKPKVEVEDEDSMWVEAPPPEAAIKLSYDYIWGRVWACVWYGYGRGWG